MSKPVAPVERGETAKGRRPHLFKDLATGMPRMRTMAETDSLDEKLYALLPLSASAPNQNIESNDLERQSNLLDRDSPTKPTIEKELP